MKHSEAPQLDKAEQRQERLLLRRDQVLDAVAGKDYQALYELICQRNANTNDVQLAIAQAEFDQIEKIKFAQDFGTWLNTEAAANRADANKALNMVRQSPLPELPEEVVW